MAKSIASTAEVSAILRANPQHLGELTRGVSTELLHAAAAGAPDWSANQVLALLRTQSDAWGGSIGSILAGDRPKPTGQPLSSGWKLGDYPTWCHNRPKMKLLR